MTVDCENRGGDEARARHDDTPYLEASKKARYGGEDGTALIQRYARLSALATKAIVVIAVETVRVGGGDAVDDSEAPIRNVVAVEVAHLRLEPDADGRVGGLAGVRVGRLGRVGAAGAAGVVRVVAASVAVVVEPVGACGGVCLVGISGGGAAGIGWEVDESVGVVVDRVSARD